MGDVEPDAQDLVQPAGGSDAPGSGVAHVGSDSGAPVAQVVGPEMSVEQAAQVAGVTPARITELCRTGVLVARKAPAPGKRKVSWRIDETAFALWNTRRAAEAGTRTQRTVQAQSVAQSASMPSAPVSASTTASPPPAGVVDRLVELERQNAELRVVAVRAEAAAREAALRAQLDVALARMQVLESELGRRRREQARLIPMFKETLSLLEDDVLAESLRASDVGGLSNPAPAGHPDDRS